ncbi:hypothetical protein CJD36_006175 [Flavipsychrobacter stenotrophus]|uniref:Uncharacterized protein n=1 Tax=Flavipsychrobacter stenotrophus TaxID=2077091 RepID=A0A2S7SXT2_9BACT|nr:hypothetical protein [Flavipsychrobacter stenotrophus]PQJ11385.1 hypothetical protein CJD36_006175 [Flavipsychrobacter stenotrophus]
MLILVGIPWLLFLALYLRWMVKRKTMSRHKRYNFQNNQYYFIINRWTLAIEEYGSVNNIETQ